MPRRPRSNNFQANRLIPVPGPQPTITKRRPLVFINNTINTMANNPLNGRNFQRGTIKRGTQASDHVGVENMAPLLPQNPPNTPALSQVEPEAEPQQTGMHERQTNYQIPFYRSHSNDVSVEQDSVEQDMNQSLFEQTSFWQLKFQSFCETNDTSPRFVCGVCAAVTSKEVKIECTIETKILDPLKSTPSGSPKLYYPAVKRQGEVLNFHVCERCDLDLNKSKCPEFSYANFPMNPIHPVELQHLSVLEKMLISKIIIMQSVFTISHSPVYMACKSSAYCFFSDPSQHVARINLPISLNELKAYVYFVIPSKRTRNQIRGLLSHDTTQPLPSYLKFLQVRKARVWNALVYLKTHNHYYNDVVLNDNVRNSLPEDGIPQEILFGTVFSTDKKIQSFI